MEKKFWLSVVIATHNREIYAKDTIRSILDFTRDDVEIVISDTSDEENLKAFIERNYSSNDRVAYSYASEKLSMTENYNRAVSMARGKYVCLIGDDDSVHPDIASYIDMMDRKNIKILTPKIIANYSWPDFETKVFGMTHAGKLYLGKYTKTIEQKSTRQQLELALKRACQGTDNLPKLYHGIVKREILERIKEEHGAYFFGVSPDISISISLCMQSDDYYTIDFPLTIPGASKKSNTGRSAMNKHQGDLDDDEHIKPFKNLDWDKRIPRFFSVETVWSQAAIETLKLYNFDSKFNFIHLYALCNNKYRDYKEIIIKSNENFGIDNKSLIKEYIMIYFIKLNQIISRMLHPSASGGKKVFGPFENIYSAVECMKNESK